MIEFEAGDPRRASVGRAIIEILAVSALFFGYVWLDKEVQPLSARAPWSDDPFDAVVSFALILLPLISALTGVRLLLCRRAEPLPRSRVDGLARAAAVLVAIVLITAGSDWASVLAREHLADWDAVTLGELVVLAVATVAASLAALHLRRAVRGLPRPAASAGPDWLADGLTLAGRCAGRLGPFARPTAALVRWLGGVPSRSVRRHPIASAVVLSTGCALGISAGMALEEGPAPVLLVILAVAACGLFAFTMAVGAYLGLVRAERPLVGTRRTMVDALVLAAAAVPIALAFRDHLWWASGSSMSPDLAHLAQLLAMAAVGTFIAVVGAEVALGIHRNHR